MFGIDYLGGAKYPKIIIDEHPTGWAAGFFANTFGNAYKNAIIPLLASGGRCPRVRIHGVWDNTHQYKPQIHDSVIDRELNRAKQLKQQFPEVDVQFSPFCEVGGPSTVIEHIIGRCLKQGTTGITLVASSLGGYKVQGAITEFHAGFQGNLGHQQFNFSFDGVDAFGADVESFKQKFRDANTFFFWSPHLNLKPKIDDTTPIAERTYRPQAKHIDALIALHRPSGEVSIPKGWILKPMSEDTGDSKSNKVVILAPINVPQMKFREVAGNQAVDTLINYGQYKEKINGKTCWRYYSSEWGYLIAEKAFRISGEKRVVLMAKGEQKGVVNPAFRAGIFR